MSEQDENTGTRPLAADDPIDVAALERWLVQNVPGFTAPLTLQKFAGGQSNPTYLVRGGEGRDYVLRRKPFGPLLPSAHAVEREYRLIAALHPTGFPVAAPLALCEDQGVIGAAFYVMEKVEGDSLWDGALPSVAPEVRADYYHAMIDTLAALHRIDIAAAGLTDYGKPGNYFERQVGRWIKQYRASETERLEDMERLITYLPASLPPQQRTAIVHGDFRVDNMIFAPRAPRVAAVLDWELSTLGDPMADLAYFLMNWVTPYEGRAGLAGLDLGGLQVPTMEAMAARYAEAMALDQVPDMNWYFAFNLFRLAGICQGIKRRILDGNASSEHAHKTAAQVPFLAGAAWHFAARAGAA